MKHKRLLRLSKLIGGFEDWDRPRPLSSMPWKPGEYERYIAKGIQGSRQLRDWQSDEIVQLKETVDKLQKCQT